MTVTQPTLDGTTTPDIASGATLSDDGTYRYFLWRRWAAGPAMTWIMLNPSTADATVTDPTIRKCMGFAAREGCGGIQVLNVFGFRSPHPRVLKANGYPEGPDNPAAWREVLTLADGPVVGAWGAIGPKALAKSRAYSFFVELLDGWALCLGMNKDGSPVHPLFIEGDRPLVRWTL